MAFWLTNESRKTPNVGDDMHTGNLPLFPADCDFRPKRSTSNSSSRSEGEK
jgi:hypothetical protein